MGKTTYLNKLHIFLILPLILSFFGCSSTMKFEIDYVPDTNNSNRYPAKIAVVFTDKFVKDISSNKVAIQRFCRSTGEYFPFVEVPLELNNSFLPVIERSIKNVYQNVDIVDTIPTENNYQTILEMSVTHFVFYQNILYEDRESMGKYKNYGWSLEYCIDMALQAYNGKKSIKFNEMAINATADKMFDISNRPTKEDFPILANKLAKNTSKELSSLLASGFAEIYDREGFDRQGFDREGNHYTGDYYEGTRTGTGTLKFKDGRTYTGQFVNGRINGHGTMTYTDGRTLSANFKDTNAHGVGYENLPDGTIFAGYWQDNQKDGIGVLIKSGSNKRIRQKWYKGKLTSTEDYKYKIKSTRYDWLYLGDGNRNGFAHGKGDAITSDGNLIVSNGTFDNGVLISGTLPMEDGGTYTGGLNNGQPDGGGSYVWTNGSKYVGDFIGGTRAGNGFFLWPDGSYYKGEFKDDQFQGKGTIRRIGGDHYEGEFANGRPHGSGIYFSGEQPERCEFYQGKRIDQVYLMRQENARAERQRELERLEEQERERQEKQLALEEQQRIEEQKARSSSSDGMFKALTIIGGTALMSMTDLPTEAKVEWAGAFAQTVITEDVSAMQNLTNKYESGGAGQSGGGKKYSVRLRESCIPANLRNFNSGDIQIDANFMEAEYLYDGYKKAVASGKYSEAECNRTYDAHCTTAKLAVKYYNQTKQ